MYCFLGVEFIRVNSCFFSYYLNFLIFFFVGVEGCFFSSGVLFSNEDAQLIPSGEGRSGVAWFGVGEAEFM